MATAIGDLVATLGINNRPFVAKIKQSQSRLIAFAGRAKAALGSIAAAFLPLSAGYAFVSLLRSGEKFNQKMRQSQAIMSDLSETMKRDMRSAAFEIARHTKYSASEAAEAYFFLASAGLNAKQSIAALPQVAQFAQAGNFNLAMATSLAADSQASLGMNSIDAAKNLRGLTRVTDVLVKANTIANATTEQFATSLTTKSGAALRAVNKDIEEGIAVLAVFAQQGLKGSDAGTRFAMVMRDLQTKSLRNAAAFKQFNVVVYDQNGAMRNMADIVTDLENALGGMSDAQKKAALLQLGFSDRAVAGIYAMLGQSEAIRKFERQLRQAGGTTKEVAGKQLTVWQKLWAFISSGAVQVGSAITAGLGKGLEWIGQFSSQFKAIGTGIYESWTAFWDRLGEETSWVLEKLGYKSGTMADAFRDSLQFIADTFSTLAFVIRNSSALSQVAFYDLVIKGLELFPKLEGPVQALGALMVGTFAGVKAVFWIMVDNFKAGFANMSLFAESFAAGFAAALPEVVSFAKDYWHFLKEDAKTAAVWIRDVFSSIFSTIWEGMKKLVGAVSDVATATGSKVADDTRFRKFTGKFTEKWESGQPAEFADPKEAFGEAYKSAAGEFNKRVERSGGMTDFLRTERQRLIDSIAKKEAGRIMLPERSTAAAAAMAKAKLPGAGEAAAITAKAQKKELPKALELGSAEAWKKITGAMYGDKKEKFAEATAKNTERIARATEETADRETEEVGIAA